jgi:hypothetical protein
MKKIFKKFKGFLEDFSRLLQEYFLKKNHKSNLKVSGCGLCYPVCTLKANKNG